MAGYAFGSDPHDGLPLGEAFGSAQKDGRRCQATASLGRKRPASKMPARLFALCRVRANGRAKRRLIHNNKRARSLGPVSRSRLVAICFDPPVDKRCTTSARRADHDPPLCIGKMAGYAFGSNPPYGALQHHPIHEQPDVVCACRIVRKIRDMQDRYAGDIGDYVKFALLRHLGLGRRLGIAWYLHPDTKDGGHTKYLHEPERWRHLDQDLFDLLSKIVQRERSVEALQAASIITAIFSGARLDCSAVAIRERDARRNKWFAEVLGSLAGCNLVFADPDNGLVDDRSDRRRRADFCKKIPLAEAKALASGRTTIIYHHSTRRKGGHLAEIEYWMEQLGPCTVAVRANAYSCRTFFILNPDEEIRSRAISFSHRWSDYSVSFVG
jgi:hypothetical protein